MLKEESAGKTASLTTRFVRWWAPYLLGMTALALVAGCQTDSSDFPSATPTVAHTVRPVTPEVAAAMTDVTTNNPATYVLREGDILKITFPGSPNLNSDQKIRTDGKITLPLVGEVQAAGRTPLKLEQEIAARLKNFIAEPEVTVIVQQINSQKINILGMVNKPGSYLLTNSSTVLDAIALAGGFRDFAKQAKIYVLRQNADGNQTRIPFNYKEVVKGQNPAQNIKLQPRDTIVVP